MGIRELPGPRSPSPTTIDGWIKWYCERQFGMVSLDQLIRAGLGKRAVYKRVEAGRLHEVYRGVFSPSPVFSDDGWRAAAVLASAPPRLVGKVDLSVWSAGELLGVTPRDPDHHHTTSPHQGTKGQDGLVVHWTRGVDPADRTRVRRLPATAAGRTLLDCAANGLVGRELEVAVGEAQFHNLLTARSLEATLERNVGHPGLALLGAVDLGQAKRRRTESPLEEEVRKLLALLPIPEPECQYWIRGLSGAWYRGDFAWEEQRVILEADGRGAHARALRLDEDRARDNDIMATGWWVMRVTRRQVRTTWPAFTRQLIARLEG